MHVFSCETSKISNNIFSYRTPLAAASERFNTLYYQPIRSPITNNLSLKATKHFNKVVKIFY